MRLDYKLAFVLFGLAACSPTIGTAPEDEEILLEAVVVGGQIESINIVGRVGADEVEEFIRPGDEGELTMRVIDDATGELLADGLVADPRINMADDPNEPALEAGEILIAVPAPSDGIGHVELELDGQLATATFTVEDAKADSGALVIAAAPILKMGMCNAAVTAVQNKLTTMKYRLGAREDRGCYGQGTWYAVQAFQRDNGIASDGEVGDDTRRKLAAPRKIVAKHPQSSGVHVEVFQGRGVTRVFKGATLFGTYASSTGAGGATPNTPSGRVYTVKAKETRSYSYSFNIWLPWASYLSGPGLTEHSIAIHESPDVPDYPASHGCVRVPKSVSQQIFQNTPSGSKVYVMP